MHFIKKEQQTEEEDEEDDEAKLMMLKTKISFQHFSLFFMKQLHQDQYKLNQQLNLHFCLI